MAVVIVLLAVLHGLIHLMGFLKAFGLAELPQLSGPISRPAGALWLAATLAMLVTGALVLLSPRWWWIAGAFAVVLSQCLIVASWGDAKLGTLANVVLLAAAALAFFARGPLSPAADFEREVARGLAREQAASAPGAAREQPITEEDLSALPAPVQRYLRLSGAVGQPRVRSYHVRFTGRIRKGPDAPWMDFTAEQVSFVDPPTRLFSMDARMFGLPVSALHMYVGERASMRVKVLSLIPMVDVAGPELASAETVTLFNDMCVMAPAALVDRRIAWEPRGERRAGATFTHAGTTIRATLVFNEAGELVDFVSDDRGALQDDGKTFVKQRWSTPLRDYRAFGRARLASFGEARYHLPAGDYAYGEFEMKEITYNEAAPTLRR